MNLEKIHLLGCDINTPRLQSVLEKITSLKSVIAPVVCLPDIHLKDRTEGPSSFAAATRGTIVPELTAPSVGCGMGIVATSLTTKDVDHVFFENFYAEMKNNLGPRYGHFKNLLLWLGIIQRPKNKYDLDISEFENVIKQGAEAAIKKYNLPPETIDSVEYAGAMFTKEEQNTINLKSILPRVSYRSGRHDLGYGFKGNHFLEIQYVEDIVNDQFAKKWGIEKNQILIMYHGGGGAVSYHIGRYFGNRKKNTLQQKLLLLPLKKLFHFGSPKDWKYVLKRMRYYFIPKQFMEIPLDDYEGTRLWQATRASQNYAYGFRMAIVRKIMDALEIALPKKQLATHLVWDSTHNAIMEEQINDEKVMIHRHTANRVFLDRPVFVAGYNTTNSYLGVGLPGAKKNLFASDHGAGVTIKQMQSTKHQKNFVTHIYQTKPPFKQIVEHQTNEGLNHVTSILEKENIVAPVALLRPLAVFKG